MATSTSPSGGRRLYYGQIRPGNFETLRLLYGHDPPWPMDSSPHVTLVEALQNDSDPERTLYFEYLRRTHKERAQETLRRQSALVRALLDGVSAPPIEIESECVLDGNHRSATGIVTGRFPQAVQVLPYQTLEFPDRTIDGRRFGQRELPIELRDKTVVDLGCAHGMMSIYALRQGASRVVAVDADLRSTTWLLRDAWGFQDRMEVFVARLEDFPRADADIVFAFSIRHHVSAEAFRRHTEGRICLMETHFEGEPLPGTHAWKILERVRYSRADPDRYRDIAIGTPVR